MFPGALWKTIIGGVGCSFSKPLTDEEFQYMRILVRDMLSPYTLLEKEMQELTTERMKYYETLEKGQKITSETMAEFHKMSTKMDNLVQSYMSELDTSLTEKIWNLFKKKALCLLTHETQNTSVHSKYANLTTSELIEAAEREIKSVIMPLDLEPIKICEELKVRLKKYSNAVPSDIEHAVLKNIDEYKKNEYLIDLKGIMRESLIIKFANSEKEKIKEMNESEFKKWISELTSINFEAVKGSYVLLVHNKSEFKEWISELTSSIKNIREINLKVETEYKLKHLIVMKLEAIKNGTEFMPTGNLKRALMNLMSYCYMGFVYSGSESVLNKKVPKNNNETLKIYKTYEDGRNHGNISIMFCFSRGPE